MVLISVFFEALKAIDLQTAEKAEAFVLNSGPLNPNRQFYTKTELKNGLELIAGGYVHAEFPSGTNYNLSSAQLYDPKTGKWTETGEMTTVRYGHAAVLLGDGRVLVAGGGDGKAPLMTAELYDPKSGTWTKTGSLNKSHGNQATLRADGKAMIYAGGWYPGAPTFDKELYDPFTGVWEVISNR